MSGFRPKSAQMLESSGYSWAEYPPHPALARWVVSYWALDTLPGKHVVRSLPDACIDLTVRLGRAPAALVTGPQRRAQQWVQRGRIQLVGARLVPGAGALLGLDATLLTEEWSPLAAHLSQAAARSLLRSVLRAADAAARVRALEAFLSKRLLHGAGELDPRLARAIDAVFAARGDLTIARVGSPGTELEFAL